MSLAKAAKDYYLRKLGEISPGEDYYLRGGTATGIWRGSGAAELGLEGAVSAERLVRLFDGQHPATGERLGRSLRKDGVAAWDVTFSADKSVSLLWALGDENTRQQVLEAFEEATGAALGYLESVASATRGATKTPLIDDQGNPILNGNGTPRFRVQTWPIATSGYVAASFTEFTSRADDPQLHTHVVVANKVKGTDGIWRTIDGRLLYRRQLAAGYLHEAVLRKELTERLGVRWQPVHNGMADIAGFTRPQIEAFSRRRHQLEEWRENQGLPDTAAARQVAVLATRTPKTDHPLADLETEWKQRAAQVGLTPHRIGHLMGSGREVAPADAEVLFERLASAEGLTKRASTFGRAEVVKQVAAALPEGGTRSQIESLAEAFLNTSDVVPLLPGRDTGRVEEPEGFVDVEQNRLPTAELTDNVRQHEPWERVALTYLRDGSVDQAIDAYQQHQRLIIGKDPNDTTARAVADWYRHVTATGDPTSGLLIAYDNDTVNQLNQQARTLVRPNSDSAGFPLSEMS
ncbi:MAG: relaxase domain-containing protein [Actinobacteria bacterium]|nr:relaxase domain-containing protein [Actinomycetota bacterium]